MKMLLIAALTGAAIMSGTASAAPADFLKRFEGSWSGSGTVQRNYQAPQRKVSCSATGSTSAVGAKISGKCRAAIIFTREFGADLTFDPASGMYEGLYTGSSIGPARLSGKRSGDALELTVTWPKEVNGDFTSTMYITNSGDGGFAVRIDDRLGPDGPIGTTTDLRFSRE